MRWSQINEGRDAPVYHMANAVKAESIFRNDTMYATHQHKLPGRGFIFGSSFTRMVRRSAYGSVWLQIDQTKLAQRHKIIPVDGEWALGYKQDKSEVDRWRDRNSEQFAEEFVVGDINDLHNYITSITLLHTKEYRMLRQEDKEMLDQVVSEYARRWNIPLKIAEKPINEDQPRRLHDASVIKWLEAAYARSDADQLYLHGSRKTFDHFDDPNIEYGKLIHCTKLTKENWPMGTPKIVALQAEYYGGVLYLVKIHYKKLFNPYSDPQAKAIMAEALKERWEYEDKIRWGRLDYQDQHLVVPPAVAAGYDLFRIYEVSIKGDSYGAIRGDMIEIVDRSLPSVV